MAVNSITFGGVNSADFGIYISGEGVFNAPQRDVEMITIPGRNGAFALDNGRFENIEVTYPAFNFEPDDYDTFMQNLSDFRNAICAQRGYQRLTDTFHPDEYRMATYIGGLEIKPIKYNTASEFNIVFDCKPQRWLTSGETAVTIANSGDTITNPTLFESSPMLEIYGYGTVSFNDYDIEVLSSELGEIKISDSVSFYSSGTPIHITIDRSNLVSHDSIYTKSNGIIQCSVRTTNGTKFTRVSVVSTSNIISANNSRSGDSVLFQITPDLSAGFVYLVSSTITCSATFQYYDASGANHTTETVSASYAYDGDRTVTVTVSRSGTLMQNTTRISAICNAPALYGDSSKIVVPAPVYIDCDIGEAYGYESGELVSYNNIVTIPADLPKLASGANTITYDNTITSLKVTPKWWKV